MFILNTDRIVTWPVEVQVPIDGGRHEQHRFTASFRLLTQSEYDAVYSHGGQDGDLLRRVVAGFDGVDIEGGRPATLDMLLDVPCVRRALVFAYIDCVSGAKRKNSATPPAAGPAALRQDKPNGALGSLPQI